MKTAAKQVRCAIYTRKSSDEGLGQEFNSLDAQRESGEAFISSHRGEGWVCLPKRYDDGGYSGGSMQRPGLIRLLEDIEDGQIDVVVVYKIDRLTRSIRDFGRIMETFESRGVAIAAVTQSINSSDSMGRLMVNVLMSFAQFERELASERTRDKIAASRKKGIWTGGRPVLGYDFGGSKLVVNESEAKLVRQIFGWYVEYQSMRALLARLESEGIINKMWTTAEGVETGGNPFSLNTISKLLSNCLYVGRVPYKGVTFDGQHEAIVDPKVFQRVQEILQENRSCGASLRQNTFGGLIKGLLTCGGCGCAMVHSTTSKSVSEGAGKVVYRYYTCRSPALIGKQKCKAGTVPAEQIESFVVDRVREELARRDVAGLVFERLRSEAELRVRDLEAMLAVALDGLADAERERDAIAADEFGQRVRNIRNELEEAREALPTRSVIEDGIAEFEGLWRNLSPTERATLIAQVVRSVRFDAKEGEVEIEWRDEESDEVAA